MITIKFYGYSDDTISIKQTFEQITTRFLVEYTTSQIKEDYNQDTEEYYILFEVEDPDYLLCEEICHEMEVYCEIQDETGTSNYYYDEQDEWIGK